VVEDSLDDTILLMRTLQKGDYEPLWERVETATEMAAALEHHAWDVVLSDYVLPSFGAREALALLHERALDLPFFVVSGHVSEETAVAAMKAGAHDYFMKENLARLVPAVERELRKADDRRRQHVITEELSKSEARLQSLIENVSDIILVLAPDGTVQYASPSSERLLGYAPEAISGTNVFAYVHAKEAEAVRTACYQALHALGTAYTVSFRFRHCDGSWWLLEAVCTGARNNTNGPEVVLNARDISEREAQAEALRRQTLYDPLTGLPNRALFCDALDQAVRAAQQKGRSLAVLCIDLEHLQDINHTFGHQWGDVVLKQVALRLQSTLRKSDTVARLGEEEFAVLLPAVTDAAGATRIARRLLQVLEPPFIVEEHPLDVGGSIGIVLSPDHGVDADTLLRRADIAVRMAKRIGSGYEFYTTEQEVQYTPGRLVLMSELRHAIDHAQLLLHYQPKASLSTGIVSEVEALLRWQHPQRGFLPPDEFIPLAEQTGVIKSLSFWVLNEALRQCHAWRQEGVDLHVAVNLSMRDLQDVRLPDTIARLLGIWQGSPTWLDVEITETALAADFERAFETLDRLRRMGIHIAVDDFGVGYSSLVYLKRLPVDSIKIDKSFVQDMLVDENAAAIVRSTIDLGHQLNLTVVAEGVEDRATWDTLATLGCDLAQGYYLSRPMPAADLVQWFAEYPGKKGTIGTVIPFVRDRLRHRG
jgi:diguanylate cyclase (GGDEF)-like protein/PAS domain S-box-containing protein